MSLQFRQLMRTSFYSLPRLGKTIVRELIAAMQAHAVSRALVRSGMGGLEKNDFNHVLHHLRGLELKSLPNNVENFVSVGCAGTWYFRWIEQCCGPIGRHIGIEYYSPKPDDLPANVEWIVNTAGDMSSIRDSVADVLFSGQNIEHLWPGEVAAFLRESHRVLKMGGLLAIDSPNRLVTAQLRWSHPEHTIELSPDEARELVELSGFEVTALRGMWLCDDRARGKMLRLDELRSTGAHPVNSRVTEAHSRPNEAFSWWLEARKTNRIPEEQRVKEAIGAIFQRAWPERVNRLLTIVGEPFSIKRRPWLRSTGKAGVLMYGPYMPLPAGQYTVRFELRRTNECPLENTEVARMDVIEGSGLELATSEICANHLSVSDSTFVALTFRLDAMTFGIQYRIIVTGTAQLIAHQAIELTCHTNPEFDVEFPEPQMLACQS